MIYRNDPSLVVALSSSQDGSVYNRHDPSDPAVMATRRKWLAPLGVALEDTVRLALYFGDDTDYCQYLTINGQDRGKGMTKADGVIGDAIVTATPGVALFLPVSDCIATTLYDPVNRVLMLSHLGRHSLEQDGGVHSVRYLVEEYGSDPSDLEVWAAPSIDKERYPIWALDGKGMKEAFHEQMERAGIAAENLHDDSRITADDDVLYSYSETLKGNKSPGSHGMVAMMRTVSK